MAKRKQAEAVLGSISLLREGLKTHRGGAGGRGFPHILSKGLKTMTPIKILKRTCNPLKLAATVKTPTKLQNQTTDAKNKGETSP